MTNLQHYFNNEIIYSTDFYYAGRPTAPSSSTMCDYDEHSQLLNVVVNLTDINMVNNEETDISNVSIAVSNGTYLEHLIVRSYSINPCITKINDTFSYHTRSVNHTEVSVHITVGDKCGQESLISEVISCTVMRPQGNYRRLT